MTKAKTRFLSLALLSIFSFVSLAPQALGDATNRNEGFYDQTYEINNNRLSFDGNFQNSSWSGAFTSSIPLKFPAGRNGMQPALTLSYNSQNSDISSFYGIGWGVSIPSIVRLNETGLNNIYTENNFSSSLSGELVNTSGANYISKVESGDFLAYELDAASSSWVVSDKSGMIYVFGSDTASRLDNPVDGSKIFQWFLSSQTDQNGNTISYEYFKENGQIYPKTIYYTGSATDDGLFTIDFALETRSDPSSFFNTGFEVKTDYRISSISASISGTVRKSYALTYIMPDDSSLSLLTSVTETAIAADGTSTSLPATQFEYSESEKGWTEVFGYDIPVYFYMNGEPGDKGVDISDVNGDGYLDLINSGLYSGSGGTDTVYLNNKDGSGWTEDEDYTVGVRFWDYSGNLMRNTRMTDLNGDGFSDILYGSTDGSKAYLFDEAGETWVEDGDYVLPVPFNSGYLEDQGVRVLDMNGDGYSDYVQSFDGSGATKAIYLFDPETKTWSSIGDVSIPYYFNSRDGGTEDEGISLGDVNGDGLVDLIKSCRDGSTYKGVYINKGDGSGWVLDADYSIPVYFWDKDGIMMPIAQVTDVNGDGLADIVQATSGAEGVFINNGDGTGWTEDPEYSVPVAFAFSYGSPEGVQLFDVNGDRFQDFVQSKSSSGATQKIYTSNSTPELLERVTHPSSGITQVSYAPSTTFDNPEMPFVMDLVSSITTDDGLGQSTSTFFDYSGGAYYYEDELHRQFAGFESISRREEDRKTISYYLQDDLTKIGRAYKTEIYDEADSLLKRSIDTWSTSDLGSEATFVYKSQSLAMDYDGESHRDTATAYTYDADGNVESVVNYGEVTGDEEGDFTDIATLNELFTVSYDYATDAGGEIRNKVAEEKITNSGGAVLKKTRYFYDGLPYGTVSTGNNTRKSDWLNSSGTWLNSHYSYNAHGLLVTARNPRDYTTVFNYDSENLYPASIVNPKSYSVSMEYDYASGQVTSRTDENGITGTTTYDGFGRQLSSSVPDPTTGILTVLSTTVYDDVNIPNSITSTSTVDGITSESVVYVDGFGRTVQTNTLAEDGNTTTVDIWYDHSGNVMEQSLPYFTPGSSFGRDDSRPSSESTYDVLNRPLTVTTPTGTSSYDYALWENTITDANGIEKTYSYDSAGHLIRVFENNDGETTVSRYAYNPLGQLIKLIDAQGNERNFIYDSLGRKISQEDLHDPSSGSFGTWLYTYDTNGNLITQTDPLGQVITWAYDQLDRVSYEDWDMSTAARDYTYAYDAGTLGLMKPSSVSSNIDDMRVVYNTYDYLGNNTKATYQYKKPGLATYFSYVFQRSYDLLNRETKVIYPSGALTVNTAYNELGAVEQLTRGTEPLTDIVSDFDYSPAGQASSITYGNGTVTSNVYDVEESYRLMGKTTSGIYGGLSGDIQSLAYSYDALGNITSIVDSSITPTAKTLSYTYDDLNRLLSAQSSGLSIGDYSESYTYDSLGNMTSKSDVGSMVYGGTGSPNPHAVTEVNGTAYTYDANGNLLSDGTHSYTWDKRNRLIGGSGQSFSYDFSGQRYKTVDSAAGTNVYTYYITPLMELRDHSTSSAGTAVYNIFAGSQRVATVSEGLYSYVLQDHLGGTALITDESGAVTEVYDYYPYGAELIEDLLGTTETAHTFTDKEFSEELGLYYFEARWYNPTIGRFASLDPAQLDGRVVKLLQDPQSLNFYAYSRNNPANFVDPSGESFGSFLSGIVNSWASNNLFGAGRYNNPNDSHYSLGQAVGDVASMVTGAMEIVAGAGITGGGAAGGLVLAPATGGVSIPAVSGTAIVTGVAVATHGATAMLSGGQNLGNDINSSSNSQKSFGATPDGHEYTKHGYNQAQNRGISGDQIDNTINNYTDKFDGSKGKTGYYNSESNITVITGDNGKIVTTHEGLPAQLTK